MFMMRCGSNRVAYVVQVRRSLQQAAIVRRQPMDFMGGIEESHGIPADLCGVTGLWVNLTHAPADLLKPTILNFAVHELKVINVWVVAWPMP
jgi:hypothetical protein